MKKAELMSMAQVVASPEMISTALENVPRKEKSRYGYVTEQCKYWLYLRCIEQDGILKACFFLPDHLRTGGSLPAYEVFLSKAERRFITYDRLHGRWLTAKLDRIDWPPRHYFYPDEVWADSKSEEVIKSYLEARSGSICEILNFQMDIREEQLLARHKRITDPWDEDLKQVPELPKDWESWVQRVGIPEHYIFYQYKRGGAKTGYCTHCGKEVPIHKPRYNKEGRCPKCRCKVTYKSEDRAGRVWTKRHYLFLLQKCRDGAVLREFEANCLYRPGERKTPVLCCNELRRVIYDRKSDPRVYYWGVFRQRSLRWNGGAEHRGPRGYWYHDFSGRVYGKTLPSLRKGQLRDSGLVDWLYQHDLVADPERYMAAQRINPALEKIVKAGMPWLVEEGIKSSHVVRENVQFFDSTSLTGILGIDSQKLKRLRGQKGGWAFLTWLQYEKASGRPIDDDLIGWFCRQSIYPKELQFIARLMSPQQIKNYLVRQSDSMGQGIKSVLNTWADYLSMAKRLKMDVNDEIVYRVRKLKERHDKLVELFRLKAPELRISEAEEKYPMVNPICASLKEKYEYADEEYMVVAPNGVRDIITEGDALSHCTNNVIRYWERIEKRESYILFLRRASAPDKPYYTLEVEPDGTVRQTRTHFDRQEEDIKDAKAFLEKWQQVIAGRLTSEDRELAKTSQVLRMEEFTELREKNAIIYKGDFAGQKLVDVLIADLMVNKAA